MTKFILRVATLFVLLGLFPLYAYSALISVRTQVAKDVTQSSGPSFTTTYDVRQTGDLGEWIGSFVETSVWVNAAENSSSPGAWEYRATHMKNGESQGSVLLGGYNGTGFYGPGYILEFYYDNTEDPFFTSGVNVSHSVSTPWFAKYSFREEIDHDFGPSILEIPSDNIADAAVVSLASEHGDLR
jgi:hypothetical protein